MEESVPPTPPSAIYRYPSGPNFSPLGLHNLLTKEELGVQNILFLKILLYKRDKIKPLQKIPRLGQAI
jgi:hypothetical protein